MDIFGGIPTGPSHDDLTAVLVPFQYRSGGNTKSSPYFGGDRYLPLRGEPRPCDRHDRNITTVMDRGPPLEAVSFSSIAEGNDRVHAHRATCGNISGERRNRGEGKCDSRERGGVTGRDVEEQVSDGHGREAGILAQHAEGEACVLQEHVDDGQAPELAVGFLELGEPSQPDAGGAPGCVRGHPAPDVLVGQHLEMRDELVLELLIRARSPSEQ